jgi:uncharacterized DUF497 family protein
MAPLPDELAVCVGFEWDRGNIEKNWDRHRVTRTEAEQAFFNRPIVIVPDERHSKSERRYALLGQTNDGRALTEVFTLRGKLIRVISARDMHRRERRFYEQASSKV